MKLIITGGDGFIGRQICRIAALRAHDVVSISRSGRPDVDESWTERVEWIAANVLQPETWRHHLSGADAVIHCVGTIRENPKAGVTYERINDDSTEIAAWEAEHAGVPRFVFLSADTPRPLVPQRYIEAKRRAEQSLRRSPIRESILRPTFVYGPERPATLVGAQLFRAIEQIPGVGEAIRRNRPLRVEQVALAAIRAATDPGYEGVITNDHIAYLAGGEWEQYANGDWRARPGARTGALLVGGVVAGVAAGVAWRLLRRR